MLSMNYMYPAQRSHIKVIVHYSFGIHMRNQYKDQSMHKSIKMEDMLQPLLISYTHYQKQSGVLYNNLHVTSLSRVVHT